jgi:hypothetical protein
MATVTARRRAFATVFLFLAAIPCAWAQKTDYTLNTPYICPDGTSYTFTDKKGTGYFSTCYYTVEKNGRLVTKAISACRQMTGYLRGCKLESSAAQPAAGQTQASLPTTEDWHSKPTNPAYLAAMPYVEKVRSAIQGTSPDDTLARQLTVFTWIPQMITHMREASRPYGSPWTPDETRITYAYNLAAKQITDAYAKTHTPAEVTQFGHQEGHYEMMDDQFYKQWTTALFPADFLNEYNHAFWGMLAEYKAHVDQERKQNEEAAAQAKAAQEAEAQGRPGLPNDAGSVAARRCLEMGGGPLSCLGKGLTTGFFDLAGMKSPESSFPARLTLTGVYAAGSIYTDFNEKSMDFGGCGNLVNQSLPYSIERKGDQFLVHVQNSPSPYTLRLEPDGKLVGPGPTMVNGQIISGYHHYWQYRYNKETGETIPGSTHEVSVPIYAPKTEQCSIAALAPTRRSLPDMGAGSWLAQMGDNALAGEDAVTAVHSIGKDMPDPGIRLAGVYTSAGGLKANFSNAAVVLDCGEAHVMDKYSVERAGGQIRLQLENSASPFTVTVEPDGSLSGPASVEVAGRIATGMTGTQVNYTPSNASCSASRLFPNGATQASSGPAGTPSQPAAASAPAASAVPELQGANATLSVTSGYPAGSNPLAGKWIFLMRKRFDDVLRATGAPLPAGTTPRQAWETLKEHCPPTTDCRKLYGGIASFFAAKLQVPQEGSGVFSPQVPSGTYYVMAATNVNNRTLFWDVKVDLKPGDNSLELDQRDQEPDSESPAQSAASEPATPAPTSSSSSAGEATLSVVSEFPGGSNPLAGKQVVLMKDRLDNLVRRGGLPLAQGASPAQAWKDMAYTCQPPKDCSALNSLINNDVVTGFTMPASGRGEFPDKVSPGTYYVSSYTIVNYVVMVWDIKVQLKPGENSLALDSRNGEYAK